MESNNHAWPTALVLTLLMTLASGVGNWISSYLMLSSKSQEIINNSEISLRAKGAEVHCDALKDAASLASEIDFSADRGYANAIVFSELIRGKSIEEFRKIPDEQIRAEQLQFEKRASTIVPLLAENESKILEQVTLNHYVVTQLRTSTVPLSGRLSPSEGGFNANTNIREIRESARALANLYRTKCTR
ncbi:MULTISPECIES: hypothetical protein [Pseudomonas]|uniref:hypothetical protein n=1 Tax=Pseudomonas TaxID=286 RepID=UPI00059EA339|nr:MULTISPECIES: hypothetical protein [Pseudomonas]MBB4057333.1 hypothetical protein [Pseudomonas koreensis]TSB50292.1 hypothetical protein FEE99_20995 [Pseudomonas sp. ef1]